jgi:hypothetical protein
MNLQLRNNFVRAAGQGRSGMQRPRKPLLRGTDATSGILLDEYHTQTTRNALRAYRRQVVSMLAPADNRCRMCDRGGSRGLRVAPHGRR